MNAVILLIDQIVDLFIWTLIAYLIIGWLVAFRIINPWQPAVRIATNFLARIHEPILTPIRRLLPDLGGIDISPIIVFLAVQFLRNLLLGFLATGY
ncbi:YggT family protein [Alphaproteobacteria bacterium]|jgi:YggT family protein|nr:YggT family protein [Alphaproteobacteria bacterium]